MHIAVILGTRPEIIKMSPVIRALEEAGKRHFVLHTGQHYSYNMDRVFFEQLQLPEAKYNLEVGSGSHSEQTAKILIGVEEVLQKENPDVVLVEGDTNSVFAGALAAAKLHIKVGHVEAGLRSYDRNMPEEINRILTDHCSDYLFAPTERARSLLLGEGLAENSIFVTGNTVADAVYQNLEIARNKSSCLETLGLNSGKYFLVTLHRQENVDDRSRFGSILAGLNLVAKEYNLPVIYPIHPRSRQRISELGLEAGLVRLIEPLDYLTFLQMESNARLILTDSGGVQEEACILGIPCVTIRDNTERPETIEVGSNVLSGVDSSRILECARKMMEKRGTWDNPFGDGKSGKRIINILEKYV